MNKPGKKSLISMALIGTLFMLALHLALVPATMAIVAESEIVGTIEDKGDGYYAIKVESEDYLVVGIDVSEWVGRTVRATGVVSEGEGGKEIHATTVEKLE